MTQTPHQPESERPQLTEAGRAFCGKLADKYFERLDRGEDGREVWADLTERHRFEWAVSSAREVGQLPGEYEGERLVDGPHRYVVKIDQLPVISPHLRSQNEKEIGTWERAVRCDIEYLFAPVVGYDENQRWLVMEETESIGSNMSTERGDVPYYDEAGEIDLLEQEDLKAEQGVSWEAGALQGQVGVDRHGNVVFIDYAHAKVTYRETATTTEPPRTLRERIRSWFAL